MTFVCSPEQLELHVCQEQQEMLPDGEKTYALLPGSYCYTASCLGYAAQNAVEFTVEKEDLTLTVSLEPEKKTQEEQHMDAADAADQIPVDAAHFPDPGFLSWVSQHADGDKDGFLSENEIFRIIGIDVSKKNIQNLTGIRYFTNLGSLQCNDNLITDLDVSGMQKLERLIAEGNKISNLNLSGCTALMQLLTNGQFLTTVNLAGCTALENLQISAYQSDPGKLKELDVSQCPNLKKLFCEWQELTCLDVSTLTSLNKFLCRENRYYENRPSFSLLDLPEEFDLSKVCSISSGLIDYPGRSFMFQYGYDIVTYVYDCGNGHKAEFKFQRGRFRSVTEKLPTCETPGMRAHIMDENGNLLNTYRHRQPVTASELTIPALGHAWSVSYIWSEDGKSCTAKAVCSRDASHVKEEKGTVTSAVTTSATQTARGKTTYTAAFRRYGHRLAAHRHQGLLFLRIRRHGSKYQDRHLLCRR